MSTEHPRVSSPDLIWMPTNLCRRFFYLSIGSEHYTCILGVSVDARAFMLLVCRSHTRTGYKILFPQKSEFFGCSCSLDLPDMMVRSVGQVLKSPSFSGRSSSQKPEFLWSRYIFVVNIHQKRTSTTIYSSSPRDESTMLCYHCEEVGHLKKKCLEYYLEVAMGQLVRHDAPPALRSAVKQRARAAIQTALDEGKQGDELFFGGSPFRLWIEWPRNLEDPAYPTRGVWHAGSYWGNDG
jgi:hypothetical protein